MMLRNTREFNATAQDYPFMTGFQVAASAVTEPHRDRA
jgi:hypothetical protein